MPFSKRFTVCERSLIFRFNCVVLNKTNSENRHLVFVIFKKKKQENDGVGDFSSLFQRQLSNQCQTNGLTMSLE